MSRNLYPVDRVARDMPPTTQTTAQEKLKTFQKVFAERLPLRVAEIESALHLFLEGEWQPEALRYVHRLVHGLAGSAGIFGYPSVGDSARRLEIPLRKRLDGGGEPDSFDRGLWLESMAELKRTCREALASGPLRALEIRSPSGAKGLARGKVLVVEDDEWLGDVIQSALAADGFEVALHREGEAALEAVAGFDPDLVLLDLVLPDLDGFEVCRRLRTMESLKDTPIFFLTSIGQESEVLKAYELGADDYLTKPLSSAVLTAKIHTAVARRQRERVKSVIDLKPGVVIDGRYRVLREIGCGGMGRVYLVRHVEIGTEFALKGLQIRTADEEHEEERFRREVHTLGELRHPNIIRIHDSGVWSRIRYYTMDHLEGGSLADRLMNEGPLTPRRALDVTAQIADALQYAHERGILHRDLKPDNILFGKDLLTPILTDFGLVLELQSGNRRLTLSGYVLGTPYYMSPEHIRGDVDIDARSDVYSLGIVLYETLTGRTPFWTCTPTEVMSRIVSRDPPRIRSVDPKLPLALDEICAKALRCERDERFATAGRFANAARLVASQIPE